MNNIKTESITVKNWTKAIKEIREQGIRIETNCHPAMAREIDRKEEAGCYTIGGFSKNKSSERLTFNLNDDDTEVVAELFAANGFKTVIAEYSNSSEIVVIWNRSICPITLQTLTDEKGFGKHSDDWANGYYAGKGWRYYLPEWFEEN